PSERHDAGDVLGAGPDAELLAAAMDDRFQGVAVAHDERADALGGTDLVAGDGKESDGNFREVDRNLAERLNGVRVERDSCLATSCRELRDRLDGPDLVVHPHHADDGHPTP